MSSLNDSAGQNIRTRGLIDSYREGPLARYFEGEVLDVTGAGTGDAAEASMDTVFAGYRLQKIADYRGALQAWFRAVRVGGHLIVSVPHTFLYERQLALPSRWDRGQKRLYTPRELIEEIEEALVPNSYRVRWLGDDDTGYDYAFDGVGEPGGAHDVVAVIERLAPPTWTLIETPTATLPIADEPPFAFEALRTRMEMVALRPHRRILILKLDHLGDFIMGLPALEKARAVFADAEITLVVGSWNFAMAKECGLADHVLSFDVFPRNSSEEEVDVHGKTALFQALMTEQYDLAIDLRTDPDTRFLLKSVQAPIRAGIGARARFPFLDIFLPVDDTRNEPETARIDEFNHHAFSSHSCAKRNDFRIWFENDLAPRDHAIVWGPYYRLRPGRYIFEPFVEIDPQADGLLWLDVGLDAQCVSSVIAPAPTRVRLPFIAENADSNFEFRIWGIQDQPTPNFSFFGGRLIRDGAASVLHQSEYLQLLIELVRMRIVEHGALQEIDPPS